VVPLPSPPVSGAGEWYGSAWAGISDSDSIIQSGVDWSVTVSSSGAYSYGFSAWYEWYPYGASDFNIAINVGDVINILCSTNSPTTGACAILDVTTNVLVSTDMSAPSGNTLTGTTAEWIVEDFSSGGLVPFANFGYVTFDQCQVAAGANYQFSAYVYPNANTAVAGDIVGSGGNVITSVVFPNTYDNVVIVNYV